MSKFSNCLKQGQKYEDELLKHIEYDTFRTSQDMGVFYDWDIETTKDDIITSYEVKSEHLASRTGNICVEYINNNKKSGIDATKADYWVHFVIHSTHYDMYVIPIERLRDLIKNKQYLRSLQGGDGYRSHFYLFPTKNLQEFKRTTHKPMCLISI